jgi:hypothetical protein
MKEEIENKFDPLLNNKSNRDNDVSQSHSYRY